MGLIFKAFAFFENQTLNSLHLKLKINLKNIQPLGHTHGGCNGCIVTMFEPWFYFILQEADEIQFESYSRIEHVITGFWLHAMRGRN